MVLTVLPQSLKYRLMIFLLLSSLFPLIFIGTISYSSIHSLLKNKAEKGVTSNLHQVRLSLENTLSQLNHASQQLIFDGRVGKNLAAYLNSDLYEKKELSDEIESEISLIHFTNPTLGLIFYYLADSDEVIFKNSHVVEDFNIFNQPLLVEQLSLSYYGPHLSLDPLDGNKVLSVVRKVELPDRDDVYLYMETNFKLTDRLMSTDEIFQDTFYFFVDNKGYIAYSENQDAFQVGSFVADNYIEQGKSNGYVLFEERSNQSWRMVAAVSTKVYNQAIQRWLIQLMGLAALSIGVGFLLAFMIYRMVYSPMIHLRRSIRRLKNDHLSAIPDFKYNRIIEFAEIHQEFTAMKHRVDELIININQSAESKKQLELENLLYKINPHFIHNTLDTIRWSARATGHDELDRMVFTLNKLLYYNLGKGQSARIHDEIEALKNYVLLQGLRYNFQFDLLIHSDPKLLELSVPRFILQPLVENSIYHGLLKKHGRGVIEVAVSKEGTEYIIIEVKDNGYGMTEVELEQLMSGGAESSIRTGLGIGWHYVHRMLELQFAGRASMNVVSNIGEGTAITLRLPVIQEEAAETHAEGHGR